MDNKSIWNDTTLPTAMQPKQKMRAKKIGKPDDLPIKNSKIFRGAGGSI
jgi:hypothetical protein